MTEVVCCLQITVHSPGQRAPFNTETRDTDHWGGSRCSGECCRCGEGDLSATVSRPGTAPPGSGSPGPWSPHWPPSPSPPCLCPWASFGANIQISRERITSDTLRWASSASLCLLLTDCCCCCRCCDPQSRCWPSCGTLVTETGSGPQPVSCVPHVRALSGWGAKLVTWHHGTISITCITSHPATRAMISNDLNGWENAPSCPNISTSSFSCFIFGSNWF